MQVNLEAGAEEDEPDPGDQHGDRRRRASRRVTPRAQVRPMTGRGVLLGRMTDGRLDHVARAVWPAGTSSVGLAVCSTHRELVEIRLVAELPIDSPALCGTWSAIAQGGVAVSAPARQH